MIYSYDTKIGRITISADEENILEVSLRKLEGEVKETLLIKRAFEQLNEYLNGKRKSFELPLAPKGTPFQKQVWDTLLKIPYGKTATYKDIATAIGNKNACRAVGMANNKNPIMVIIPCHRVIGSNGDLTGYAGGLNIKKQLINIEQS